jgi:hypothetical protein
MKFSGKFGAINSFWRPGIIPNGKLTSLIYSVLGHKHLAPSNKSGNARISIQPFLME